MTDVTSSQWRWVVLASSFFSILLTGYAQYHVGVMKLVLLDRLDSDVDLVTWLMSYYASCFALAAPVGSALSNVTSCRTCVVMSGLVCLLGFVLSSLVNDLTSLFFTFTLLGIGQGMCTTGSIVILGYYFPEQTSIASGVSISGGALGTFVHPPLLQGLVDWYGLQGALLLSGAVAFQGSVFGALMRTSSLEKKTIGSRKGGNVLQKFCALFSAKRPKGQGSPLMSRTMALFLLAVFVFSLGFHSLMVLLPYHLVHVGGLTPTEASFAVSVTGVGSFISRLATGFLSHDPRVGPALLFCGLNGVEGLLSLAAPSLIALGIVGAYVYSFMFGLYTGGVFSLFLPFLQQIVGLHHCSTAFGMSFFVLGVGGIVGAPLTNFVHQQSLDVYVMFGFIGALFCTAGILGSLVTTVLPQPLSATGQKDDPDYLPASNSQQLHEPEPGEEAQQLTEKQTLTSQKQASSPNDSVSYYDDDDDTTADSIPLAKLTYKVEETEETNDQALLEVTKPLMAGEAEVRV